VQNEKKKRVLLATTCYVFSRPSSKDGFGHKTDRHGCYRRKNTSKFDVSATRMQWKTSWTRIRPKIRGNNSNFCLLTRARPGFGGLRGGDPIHFRIWGAAAKPLPPVNAEGLGAPGPSTQKRNYIQTYISIYIYIYICLYTQFIWDCSGKQDKVQAFLDFSQNPGRGHLPLDSGGGDVEFAVVFVSVASLAFSFVSEFIFWNSVGTNEINVCPSNGRFVYIYIYIYIYMRVSGYEKMLSVTNGEPDRNRWRTEISARESDHPTLN